MICSPTKRSGVFKNLEVLVFEGREKTGAFEQKLPGAKKRTNDTPKFDPGPHLCEASALTNALP